jgi:flagellin-like hook-associated protein FlgL
MTQHAKMQRGLGELDDMLQGLTSAQASIGSGLKGIDQQNSVIEDTVLNIKTTTCLPLKIWTTPKRSPK